MKALGRAVIVIGVILMAGFAITGHTWQALFAFAGVGVAVIVVDSMGPSA